MPAKSPTPAANGASPMDGANKHNLHFPSGMDEDLQDVNVKIHDIGFEVSTMVDPVCG